MTGTTAQVDTPTEATPPSEAAEHPKIVARAGSHSIWGPVQTARHPIRGLAIISTASHGGIIISESRRLLLPEYMRLEGDGHSYEEDEAWSIVVLAFEAELLASGDKQMVKCIREGHHTDTLKHWHPDIYERHFGLEIPPGESHVKDERAFYAEHAGDYVVSAAFGSWHERIPEGMVGVVARLGGRSQAVSSERYFLVPEGEYEARGRFGFVIDLSRHEAIEPFR